MQLAAAYLCDFATVREGLLYTLAGGIARINRPEYPAPLLASLAVLIELHRTETGRPHELAIMIQDSDGKRLFDLQGGFEIALQPDADIQEKALAPIGLDLRQVRLDQPGTYSIEISLDGEHRRTITFRAMLTKPAEAPGGPPPAPPG